MIQVSSKLFQPTLSYAQLMTLGRELKSKHFHDLDSPKLSVRPANLLLSCHANSLLQILWTCYCYRFTTCWLAPWCLHGKSPSEPKQIAGLSMHPRIVCSQKLFGIFYSLLSDALNSSCSTWHLTLPSLYCTRVFTATWQVWAGLYCKRLTVGLKLYLCWV